MLRVESRHNACAGPRTPSACKRHPPIFCVGRRSRHERTLNNAFMAPLSGGQGHAAMLGPYARRGLMTGPCKATKDRTMKTTLTVAALALAIAAPAFAQDARPATTP